MPHKQPQEFEDETIAALRNLGEALREVHDRLIREGYTFIEGKWIPPSDQQK